MSPKVCIVGAGVSGICTAFALSRRNIPFDWFDSGSSPGGLWRFGNDSGMSAVYDTLVTNTSAPNMRLFGFQPRWLGAGYLSHREACAYLDEFIEASGIRSSFTGSTTVTSIQPTTGGFLITAGIRNPLQYSSVVIAHGRNWYPVMPKFKGSFQGTIRHSIDYKSPASLAGLRVVVCGFGNTGADIAVDAAGCAAAVTLSTRDGGFLSSRYAGGQPVDVQRAGKANKLPRWLRRELARLRLKRRGLSAKVVEALESRAVFRAKPPVINDHIAALIDSGAITVRPGISRLDGNTVHFTDRSTTEADLIITATGFETVYPFFDSLTLDRNDHFRDRYLRVLPPGEPGLYFVGHAAVLGPVWPVLEEQARWVAAMIAGECPLPPRHRLERLAREDSRANTRICPQSTRGEDTVETYPYLEALRRVHRLPAEQHSFLPAAKVTEPSSGNL